MGTFFLVVSSDLVAVVAQARSETCSPRPGAPGGGVSLQGAESLVTVSTLEKGNATHVGNNISVWYITGQVMISLNVNYLYIDCWFYCGFDRDL